MSELAGEMARAPRLMGEQALAMLLKLQYNATVGTKNADRI